MTKKDARVIIEYSLGNVVGSVEWNTECISIGKKERLFDETDDPIIGGRGYVLSRPWGWRSIDATTRVAVLFPELGCSERAGIADWSWSDNRVQHALPTVVLLRGKAPSQLFVLYATRPQPILDGEQFTLRRVRFEMSDNTHEVTDLARVSERRLAAAQWRYRLSQQINPFDPEGNEFDVATFFVLGVDMAEVKSVLPNLETVSIIAGRPRIRSTPRRKPYQLFEISKWLLDSASRSETSVAPRRFDQRICRSMPLLVVGRLRVGHRSQRTSEWRGKAVACLRRTH